jgi:hypothetical protein
MVKFRGIEISIVSQFDIRKIPEFVAMSNRDPFAPDDKATASCYVPIYPGSQLWFEYSLDGPHPPNASYLFKILHNSRFVTSFDCTAKQ